MVPSDDFRAFIEKAKASGGAEMANCQPFIERLCRFLSLPEPDLASEHNHRNDYVYERRIEFKHPDGTTSPGRIDLYKRGHFILEAEQSAKRVKPAAADQSPCARAHRPPLSRRPQPCRPRRNRLAHMVETGMLRADERCHFLPR